MTNLRATLVLLALTTLSVSSARAQHETGPWRALAREASGTAWDSSPVAHAGGEAGEWSAMLHGRAFLFHADEGGERGEAEWVGTNWLMGHVEGPVLDGRLRLRAMASVEPWTVQGCGYPNLLQSGELCDGLPIADAQHPHDLFMELSATYARAIAGGLVGEVYLAPVGEPALGPAAFVHRASSRTGPRAPIAHHWMDATHVSFGVATVALAGERWKAEASVFNGREPDQERTDFDFAPLYSTSARIQVEPVNGVVAQVSAGRLRDSHAHVTLVPEVLLCPASTGCHREDAAAGRLDVDRLTASISWSGRRGTTGWAATAAWGSNREEDHGTTHALLLEGDVGLGKTHRFFGRAERVEKSDHELGIRPTIEDWRTGRVPSFPLQKLTLGYAYRFDGLGVAVPAVGVEVGWNRVPDSLEDRYGSRDTASALLFLSVERL